MRLPLTSLLENLKCIFSSIQNLNNRSKIFLLCTNDNFGVFISHFSYGLSIKEFKGMGLSKIADSITFLNKISVKVRTGT